MHWLSEETLQLIRKKRRVYKLAKRSNRPQHIQQYRDISIRVRHLTRQDHRQHLQNISSDLSHDQRPFWRWLNNMRGVSSRFPDINSHGTLLSTAHEKAKAFGELFVSFLAKENTSKLKALKPGAPNH